MHRTHVRGRKSRWEASCSCGWAQEAVSGFGAWAAARRHSDRAAGVTGEPAATRSEVRVLGGHRAGPGDDAADR